jgi:hypothetical protein
VARSDGDVKGIIFAGESASERIRAGHFSHDLAAELVGA